MPIADFDEQGHRHPMVWQIIYSVFITFRWVLQILCFRQLKLLHISGCIHMNISIYKNEGKC